MFTHAIEDCDVANAAADIFDRYVEGDKDAINVNILEPVFASVLTDEDAEDAVSLSLSAYLQKR